MGKRVYVVRLVERDGREVRREKVGHLWPFLYEWRAARYYDRKPGTKTYVARTAAQPTFAWATPRVDSKSSA
jgi:hypothetical protein